MRNPYEELFKPELENPQGEDVEGAFSCQERDCFSTVGQAKYLEELRILTWICKENHLNKIEGFNL